jgi:hypothetical protein
MSGIPDTFQVTATGHPAITYSLDGTEPVGVSINSASGMITFDGTTPAGDYTFTITAANGIVPDAAQIFTLTVNEAPTIISASSTTVTSGTGSTFQVTATGHPAISYSLTGEPAGVNIDGATGLITIDGTVAVGSYVFTIAAANGIVPDDTQSFTLTVNARTGGSGFGNATVVPQQPTGPQQPPTDSGNESNGSDPEKDVNNSGPEKESNGSDSTGSGNNGSSNGNASGSNNDTPSKNQATGNRWALALIGLSLTGLVCTISYFAYRSRK